MIITTQMGDVGGEGAARERRIVEIARAGGMRILGPNCLGLVNTRARLALTASFAMGVERLPVGPIGVVSQSGALMATMFSRGYDVGVGFSILVSVGNQADVTENEVFAHLISDEATRAIVPDPAATPRSACGTSYHLARPAAARHRRIVQTPRMWCRRHVCAPSKLLVDLLAEMPGRGY